MGREIGILLSGARYWPRRLFVPPMDCGLDNGRGLMVVGWLSAVGSWIGLAPACSAFLAPLSATGCAGDEASSGELGADCLTSLVNRPWITPPSRTTILGAVISPIM